MKKHLMKRLFRPLIFLLILNLIGGFASTSFAQQSGTSPVKIYLMVGQSNMEGKGQINGLTTPGTLEYIVANEAASYGFLKDGNGDWIVRDDVWMHFERSEINLKTGGLTPGFGSSDTMVGPEIGFGHAIGDTEGNQVLLIKTAWGGKSLGNDFLPPSSGPYPAPEKAGDAGFYYAEMLRIVEDATSNLSTYFPDYDGQGHEIAGLCFHQGWNDQYGGLDELYETNLVNFINDIRSSNKGLGVPDLPIVIASSGMIEGVSLIKQAQLAMANLATYPQFDGNVAVVDTEQTYAPLGLDFMQDVANSPINQAFHWNQNARTYTNIGLAMANEMALLTAPRCPSRLRATGTASGVVLSWQNGSETPTSVEILRDGVTIAATAPSTPALFTDITALPGVYAYEIRFTMPVTPCDPLTVSHDSGIKNLIAYRGATGVVLEWQNNLGYAGIKIQRNGVVVEASLAGTAVTYTDTAAPATGVLTYSLVPTTGTSTAAEVQINLGPHDAGGALIYEPFDYPAPTSIKGYEGATGTTGAWLEESSNMNVTYSGLSFGSLPVVGNKLENTQFGRRNKISIGTTLSDAGLLADGATLWFSMLVKPLDSSNVSSQVMLGNSVGESNGVGINISNTRLDYRVVTNGLGANNVCSNGALSLLKTQLLVGKLTWGTGGADDSFLLYLPGTDLTHSGASRSADPFNFDQSAFDEITIFMQNSGTVDELRFGATYDSVTGAGLDTSDDFTAPSPETMTWAIAPNADSETAISMTAVTASDANNVQYLFTETSGNPGSTSSDWQLSSSFTDTGLTPGMTYSYTVQARDLSSNQNTNTVSTASSATTDALDEAAPPTPTLVTPFGVTSSTISLTANAVTDPEGKSVEYRFTNTTLATNSGWLTSPSHTETGLTPETTYSFTVEARDTASTPNISSPSAEQSATTLVAPPATATLTDNTAIPLGGGVDVSIPNGSYSTRGGGGATTSFNNPIVDYAFYEKKDAGNSNTGIYASGGSLISSLSSSGNDDTKTNLWKTSILTYPADFTTRGVRSTDGSTFTVDISDLNSGSIYIFNGSWQARTDWLDVSMTGAGQTAVTTHTGGAVFGFAGAVSGQAMYAKQIDFTDAALYDTITFTLQESGSSEGYFAGVVLTSAPAVSNPYDTWAGGEVFGGDKNGDGVENGIAFLLGAASPDEDALDRLPTGTETAGDLVMSFTCLKGAGRGGLVLNVEYSSDLGQSDPWSSNQATVPSDVPGGTINDVVFVVTENTGDSALVDVIATIPATKAVDGKIFARLSAVDE